MSCVGDIGGRPNYQIKSGFEKEDKYPYEETTWAGDPEAPTEFHYLVLGPDVWASRDGDLINWRGVNYVRQTPIAVPDPLEEKHEYIDTRYDGTETRLAYSRGVPRRPDDWN